MAEAVACGRRVRRTLLAIVGLLAVGTGCAGFQSTSAAIGYERSGGLAGESTRLTVTPDGTATLDGSGGARHHAWTRRLSADQWRALRSALDAARLDTLDARYGPSGTCNDCVAETVRYRGRTVTVEGAPAPSRLAPALELLDALAARR